MNRQRRERDEPHEQVEVENLTRPVAEAIAAASATAASGEKKKRTPSERSSPLDNTRRFVCRQCTVVLVGVLAFMTALTHLVKESEGGLHLFNQFLNATSKLLTAQLTTYSHFELSKSGLVLASKGGGENGSGFITY